MLTTILTSDSRPAQRSSGFRKSKSWGRREDEGKTRIEEHRSFTESEFLRVAAHLPALAPTLLHIRHVSRIRTVLPGSINVRHLLEASL